MFGNASRLDFRVDLNKPPERPVELRPLFWTEDAESTEIRLTCYGGDGRPFDLTGCTASLYVQRADGATVLVPGTVEGERVSFCLPEAALIVQGGLLMAARIEQTTGTAPDTVTHRKVIWTGEAAVRLTSTDTVVDSSDIIPSLSELLAQIERMENLHDNNVRGYYSTVEALEAAQTDPYPGDLYGVGTSSYTYYIWDGVASEWKDLGDIYQPKAAMKSLWTGSVAGGSSVTISGLSAWGTIGLVLTTGTAHYPVTCLVHDGIVRAVGGTVTDGYHYTAIINGTITDDTLAVTTCTRLAHQVNGDHGQSATALTVTAVYGIARKESAE